LSDEILIGEHRRKLDDRFRLLVPNEWMPSMSPDGENCILTKERVGSLSLWNSARWQKRLDDGVDLMKSKINAGKLNERLSEVQLLGRLLSTRHKQVPVAERGRIVIPDGFREFLGVEAGQEVMIVGAAICIEIWHPEKWIEHLGSQMPEFGTLFDNITG
jgi:MraZ protein